MSLLEWQSQLSRVLVLPDLPESASLSALGKVDGSKLALYEELIFNTVRDTLQNIYPFTYALLSHDGKDMETWKALADQYRRACPNRSYKLMGAVSGFHEYLGTQAALMDKYPFLPDLALYEWLEMEVMNLLDCLPYDGLLSEVPQPEDFGDFCPVWNPARRLRAFDYNVPALLDWLKENGYHADAQPITVNPVEILIYRDPQTLDARFFCLNVLTAFLMRLGEQGVSYEEALLALKAELPALRDIPLEVIRGQAAALFQNCLEKGILLGSVPV